MADSLAQSLVDAAAEHMCDPTAVTVAVLEALLVGATGARAIRVAYLRDLAQEIREGQ